MIRRWSYLNTFGALKAPIDSHFLDEFTLGSFFYLKKKNKVTIFKTSVKYRKTKLGFTKFKRKTLTRIKHSTNFLIYTNVFKYWSKDYMFNKHIIKHQFFFNILDKNSFVYNYSFIKNKNENIFYDLNFILSVWTKKSRSHCLRFWPKTPHYFFYKNNNISFAWFTDTPTESVNTSLTLSYAENEFFLPESFPYKKFYDFQDLFVFIYFLILAKQLEFYKIINFMRFSKV